MLQLLNVDQKKEGEDNSEEENTNGNTKSLSNIVEKKLILPNLQHNNQPFNIKDPLNHSEEFNNIDEIIGNGNLNTSSPKDNNYNPKM